MKKLLSVFLSTSLIWIGTMSSVLGFCQTTVVTTSDGYSTTQQDPSCSTSVPTCSTGFYFNSATESCVAYNVPSITPGISTTTPYYNGGKSWVAKAVPWGFAAIGAVLGIKLIGSIFKSGKSKNTDSKYRTIASSTSHTKVLEKDMCVSIPKEGKGSAIEKGDVTGALYCCKSTFGFKAWYAKDGASLSMKPEQNVKYDGNVYSNIIKTISSKKLSSKGARCKKSHFENALQGYEQNPDSDGAPNSVYAVTKDESRTTVQQDQILHEWDDTSTQTYQSTSCPPGKTCRRVGSGSSRSR